MSIFSEVMAAGTPSTSFDPSTSPYFGAQDWGEGSYTMGNADGSGFFNFAKAGVDSPFGDGSSPITADALNSWMSQTGMGLQQSQGPAGDYRWLTDSAGNQVGDKQFTSANESAFMAAVAAAMALTGANIAGAGGVGGGGFGGDGAVSDALFGGGAADAAPAGLGGAFPGNASVAGLPGYETAGLLDFGGAAYGGGGLEGAMASLGAGTGAESAVPSFRPSQNYGPGMTGLQTSVYDGAMGLGANPEMAKILSATAGGELTFADIMAGLGSVGIGGARASGGFGIPSLFNIGSGLYGLSEARRIRKAMDPFGSQRGKYAAQLAALEANPGSIVSRPGWRAGEQAVNRNAAASGYLGSGNQMIALQKYGGDFYNAEAQRLAQLAGAGFSPGAGSAQAAELAGSSLASLGYGIAPLFPRKGG